jgi:hypothetical protein
MRPAELVVTYHAGPKPASEHVSYAGVFRADPAMERIYAEAEPPTHDSWNPQSLAYPDSTFVRSTFQRIKESLTGLLDLGGGARSGSAQVALGAASGMFSSLVGGSWGTGGATDYGKPGGTDTARQASTPSDSTGEGQGDTKSSSATSGGGSEVGRGTGHPAFDGETSIPAKPVQHRPRVEYVRDPYFDERSGAAVLVQPFRLPVAGPQRVRVDLAVALPGTGVRETDPPLGAEMPGLVGWEDASETLFATPTHVIEGGDNAVWHAVVRPAPDTMTEIAIVVERVHAS